MPDNPTIFNRVVGMTPGQPDFQTQPGTEGFDWGQGAADVGNWLLDWWGGDDAANGAANGGNGNGNGVGAETIQGMGKGQVVPCGLYAPVVMKQRATTRPGYVVVRNPQTKAVVGMEKRAAIRCGLYHPAKKPPITASQYGTLRKARAVSRKVDSLVKMSNELTGKAKFTRSRTKRC